jgi:hypothetical protein
MAISDENLAGSAVECILAVTGWLLNAAILYLMWKAKILSYRNAFSAAIVIQDIIRCSISIFQYFSAILAPTLITNYYVCQFYAFQMVFFNFFNLNCNLMAVLNPFRIAILKKGPLSFIETLAWLMIIFGTSFFLSAFIYFGGESYYLAENESFCYLGIYGAKSTWTVVTLVMHMIFPSLSAAMAIYCYYSICENRQLSMVSRVLNLEFLVANRGIVLLYLSGVFYGLPVAYILATTVSNLSPPVSVEWFAMCWSTTMESILNPIWYYMTEIRLGREFGRKVTSPMHQRAKIHRNEGMTDKIHFDDNTGLAESSTYNVPPPTREG